MEKSQDKWEKWERIMKKKIERFNYLMSKEDVELPEFDKDNLDEWCENKKNYDRIFTKNVCIVMECEPTVDLVDKYMHIEEVEKNRDTIIRRIKAIRKWRLPMLKGTVLAITIIMNHNLSIEEVSDLIDEKGTSVATLKKKLMWFCDSCDYLWSKKVENMLRVVMPKQWWNSRDGRFFLKYGVL